MTNLPSFEKWAKSIESVVATVPAKVMQHYGLEFLRNGILACAYTTWSQVAVGFRSSDLVAVRGTCGMPDDTFPGTFVVGVIGPRVLFTYAEDEEAAEAALDVMLKQARLFAEEHNAEVQECEFDPSDN